VHVDALSEQLEILHNLIDGFGLDRNVATPLQNKVAAVEAAIVAGGDGCAELDDVLLAAISRAAKGELPFASAAELIEMTNQIETAAGCLPVGSTLPSVQLALIGLLQTSAGLGLPKGEEALLAEQTRNAADAAVAGDPCAALHDLAARIAADMGNAGRLTAAQGATLSTQVAAVATLASCA
jgi:hypothetical protein